MSLGKFIIQDEDGNVVDVRNGALFVSETEALDVFTQEYTADSNGDVAAAAIISPTSGKQLSIKTIQILTDGASGTISLDFATSSIKVSRLYPSKNTSVVATQLHIDGTVDEDLTLTIDNIGNGSKVFVMVGYENEDTH